MHELDFIQKVLIWSIPVIFAITLHEVSHGWVASKLGDPTAKMLGRLTINPIKHIDLVGTIIIPAILILLPHINFVFGWAKPVPVTYQNLHHPRRDMAIVAAAGPLSNLAMAIFWAAIVKLVIILNIDLSGTLNLRYGLSLILIYMGYAGMAINLVLMVLNLLPIPPLDGSRVISSLLPRKASYYYNKLGNAGFLIILILLASGGLSTLLKPPIIFLFDSLFKLFDLYTIQRII